MLTGIALWVKPGTIIGESKYFVKKRYVRYTVYMNSSDDWVRAFFDSIFFFNSSLCFNDVSYVSI